jgi:hypothetical protein
MESLLLPSRVEYGSSGGVVAVHGGDDWAWVMGIADWICCTGNVLSILLVNQHLPVFLMSQLFHHPWAACRNVNIPDDETS